MPPATASAAAKKKKPKKKRHTVNVGDIVMFHSQHQHLTGSVGQVTHILSRDEIVIREMSAIDRDYEGLSWVIKTYKPSGTAPDGGQLEYIWMYIKKVIVRTTPLPPKPPRQEKPAKVLASAEELIQHLKSDTKEKVVYIPPAEATA